MIKDYSVYKNGIKKILDKNDLSKLNNSKILITGINGMIASAIADVLLYLKEEENYNIDIIGIARNKMLERFNNKIKVYNYDIQDKFEIDEAVDYIINAASPADPASFASMPVEIINANYIGTKNLLDYGLEHNVKRLLYVSSGEIYGQGAAGITSFDEKYRGFIDSTNPRSCYPIGKLAAETLCASYTKEYGIETIIARPCHTYGPTQKNTDSRVVSQFILNVTSDKDIIMKSKGEQVRSYTYVLDSAAGILIALINGTKGEAYNVANNASIISIKDMAEKIANIANKKVIFELPTDIEKNSYNPASRSVLNGQKLESIGWKPCYTFDTGIEETIKLYKQ